MSRILRYLWAAPNTGIGVLLLPGVCWGGGGMQVVDGVLEIHGPVIAWILRRCVPLDGGAAAITLGHIVAGCDERTLSLTRAHERVHVRQCERWGPAFIPAYLLASLFAYLAGAGAYEGNYFEREARMVHVE